MDIKVTVESFYLSITVPPDSSDGLMDIGSMRAGAIASSLGFSPAAGASSSDGTQRTFNYFK